MIDTLQGFSIRTAIVNLSQEMQSIEDLENWQVLSSHVLDNLELLKVAVKKLAGSEKKANLDYHQVHVVPQIPSDRSDSVKKNTELTLQNDILQAEVKALRSKEESQAQKLRQLEIQNDHLTKKLEKQDLHISAMEKTMKSTDDKYKKELEDLLQSMGTMQQHKEMLKSLVQRLQDTQIPDNVYVLRSEFDSQERLLMELENIRKGHENQIRSFERKENENTKTLSAQQQQLFACVAREQQNEGQMQDLQRQLQAAKQELDCVKGMYMEECRKSEGLIGCLHTAERSLEEVRRQFTAVNDMHKQATQRCEELRKEVHALWEHNRSLLQSQPPQQEVVAGELDKSLGSPERGRETVEGKGEGKESNSMEKDSAAVGKGEVSGIYQPALVAGPTANPAPPAYNLDEKICGKCRADYSGIMLQCRGCKRKFHSHCAKQDFRVPGQPDTPCAIKDLGKGLCAQCFAG